MKRMEAILAAALLAGLAGCAARAKPIVPPPSPVASTAPPQPLSIPQTQVQLPRQQPVDPDALATASPPADPPAAPPPAVAKPTQSTRRQAAATPPAPKADPPPPVVETARPLIQEILPPDVQQQLRRSAADHRRQARQFAAQAQHRNLTPDQQANVTRINQFVKSSIDAENNGDLRSADDLASRAHILARELQSGK